MYRCYYYVFDEVAVFNKRNLKFIRISRGVIHYIQFIARNS